MPARYMYMVLAFFAVAFAAGLAITVGAPVSGIRLMGLLAMLFAAGGFALELYELQREDPHALSVIRYRLLSPLVRMRDALTRATLRLTRRTAAYPAP
jgi:hypothetical protein